MIVPLQKKLNIVEFDSKVLLNCAMADNYCRKVQRCKIVRLPELVPAKELGVPLMFRCLLNGSSCH